MVERLRSTGAEDVFLLTPGPVEAALIDAAAAAAWTPRFHALGSLVGRELFTPRPGFRGRLHLAFGSLPVDRTPPGLERFHEALAPIEELQPGGSVIAAFNAIDLLVDGLERAGRDLSREGLIEALEVLRDRPTGLTPPFSFGPNRRVAVRGSYVVTLDPARPQSPEEVVWVEP
jgi:ABC-type branched-subunit amino acid transport system substrate-binding protein